MPNYGDPEYWENRYREQEGRTFDWLEDWTSLKEIVERLVSKDASVLILGCGNSEFSEQMYSEGYERISNIDISTVVIEQMAMRNSDKPTMTWQVMDVRDLKFPEEKFDIAIDKSTIDALLCGEDAYLNVAKMTREVQRTLKTGGTYMAISYGTPESRLEHFHWEHLHWDVSNEVIGEDGDNPHYIYLCRKKEGADQICQEKWAQVEESLMEDDIPEDAD